MPRIRTPEETEAELSEQIASLREFGADFDSGNTKQAKYLAGVAYVLLHDGRGRTKSLLNQARVRSKVDFVSSLRPIPRAHDRIEWTFCSPLVYLSGSFKDQDINNASFKALFNEQSDPNKFSKLSFRDWYSEPITPEGWPKLSRKNLICSLRNQDGGGHFDATIQESDYLSLKLSGVRGLKWEFTLNDDGSITTQIKTARNKIGAEEMGEPTLNPPHVERYMMRQIAWEIDSSLKLFGL